jgi:hypothetical protein
MYIKRIIQGLAAEGIKAVSYDGTLRFEPWHPNFIANQSQGEASSERAARELSGRNHILVMASTEPWEVLSGGMKILGAALAQRQIGGQVAVGSARDTDEAINFGFPVWFFFAA